ncbi:MAG: DedA family protein [Hyphomicrobiaceae bacterium]|nr:DedA family protein [Hyphomicrobiaceae bacterium]
MALDQYWGSVLRFVRENETFIEVALFLFAFAESIIFASVFVPSTLIFIAIGALEGAANGALFPLVVAGALGALAGDMASFAIGYRVRGDIGKLWGLRDHPGLLEGARAFVARWGIMAVVVSKLAGPLRPIVPMLAGATSMPLPLFLAASAASSVLWSVLVLVPAYYGFSAVTQ